LSIRAFWRDCRRGAEEAEDDDEQFDDKIERLTAKLEAQFAETA
jgi:hypothetical protein